MSIIFDKNVLQYENTFIHDCKDKGMFGTLSNYCSVPCNNWNERVMAIVASFLKEVWEIALFFIDNSSDANTWHMSQNKHRDSHSSN